MEQRRRPELKGRPTAVVQYNPWKVLNTSKKKNLRILYLNVFLNEGWWPYCSGIRSKEPWSNKALYYLRLQHLNCELKLIFRRCMRGDEARDKCPSITLVQVPVSHGKADLSIYRNAGSEVFKTLFVFHFLNLF